MAGSWLIFHIILKCVFCGVSALNAYSMDIASSKIILGSTSTGRISSGILKSHSGLSYDTGRNRSLTISAPPKSGIVASIRLLDFRPHCQDILTLYDPTNIYKPISMCNKLPYRNREEDPHEIRRTYYAPSGNLVVIFETDPGNSYTYDGFELTFTVVSVTPCLPYEYKCDNYRCIAEILRCDGYNHCGDLSDQKDCGEIKVPVGEIIGSVCVILLLIIAAVYVCYIVKKKAESLTESAAIQQGGYPKTYTAIGSSYPPISPAYTQNHQSIPT